LVLAKNRVERALPPPCGLLSLPVAWERVPVE
jgi:hypothetical protein